MFRRVAREDEDILSPGIELTANERLEMLEYFVPRVSSGSVDGWADDRGYWLARLYEATGQPLRAKAIIEERMQQRGQRPTLWVELLERVSSAQN